MYRAWKKLGDTGYAVNLLYCGEEGWANIDVYKRDANDAAVISAGVIAFRFEETPTWPWYKRIIWGRPDPAPSHEQQLQAEVVRLIARCEAKLVKNRADAALKELQKVSVDRALEAIGFTEEWDPDVE